MMPTLCGKRTQRRIRQGTTGLVPLFLLLAACSPLSSYPDCGVAIDVPPLDQLVSRGFETAAQWDDNAYMERADISIDPDGSVRTEEVRGGQSIGIEMAVNRDQEFIPSQEVYETAAAAACSLLGHDSVERVMFTLLRNLLQEPLNPVWRVAFSKVNGSTVYATLDALTGEVTEVKD